MFIRLSKYIVLRPNSTLKNTIKSKLVIIINNPSFVYLQGDSGERGSNGEQGPTVSLLKKIKWQSRGDY